MQVESREDYSNEFQLSTACFHFSIECRKSTSIHLSVYVYHKYIHYKKGEVYLMYKKRMEMGLMTTITLSKWGNSSAIRIPNQILKQLNLEEGAELQIMVTPENDILLHPSKKPHESNEELRAHMKRLLSKIKPDSSRHEEIDYGIEGDELI
jgi:antitoxin MazE